MADSSLRRSTEFLQAISYPKTPRHKRSVYSFSSSSRVRRLCEISLRWMLDPLVSIQAAIDPVPADGSRIISVFDGRRIFAIENAALGGGLNCWNWIWLTLCRLCVGISFSNISNSVKIFRYSPRSRISAIRQWFEIWIFTAVLTNLCAGWILFSAVKTLKSSHWQISSKFKFEMLFLLLIF